MGTKGGIAKFIEEAKNSQNNPNVLNKIIEAMSEKIDELQAKAEAYDELMQRQVTRQELANITNHPVAVSEDCTEFVVFSSKPELEDFCCGEEEGDHLGWIGERLFSITLRDQYDGCWWTSLTLPYGWEEK